VPATSGLRWRLASLETQREAELSVRDSTLSGHIGPTYVVRTCYKMCQLSALVAESAHTPCAALPRSNLFLLKPRPYRQVEAIDQARLLPHLRDRAEMLEQQRSVLAAHVAKAREEERDVALPKAGGMAGGDKRQLRFIPVATRGVGSVVPGTQPEAEIVRREREQFEPMRIRANPRIGRAA
jgi:hypothetical protein